MSDATKHQDVAARLNGGARRLDEIPRTGGRAGCAASLCRPIRHDLVIELRGTGIGSRLLTRRQRATPRKLNTSIAEPQRGTTCSLSLNYPRFPRLAFLLRTDPTIPDVPQQYNHSKEVL
jgi:hypothetical protein